MTSCLGRHSLLHPSHDAVPDRVSTSLEHRLRASVRQQMQHNQHMQNLTVIKFGAKCSTASASTTLAVPCCTANIPTRSSSSASKARCGSRAYCSSQLSKPSTTGREPRFRAVRVLQYSHTQPAHTATTHARHHNTNTCHKTAAHKTLTAKSRGLPRTRQADRAALARRPRHRRAAPAPRSASACSVSMTRGPVRRGLVAPVCQRLVSCFDVRYTLLYVCMYVCMFVCMYVLEGYRVVVHSAHGLEVRPDDKRSLGADLLRAKQYFFDLCLTQPFDVE